MLQFSGHFDAAKIFDEHQRWNQQMARPLQPASPAYANDRSPDRRLRIGYVSPDFHEHSVSFFFEGLLAHHDSAQVETFCYADLHKPDEVTARLKQAAHHWRQITCIPDARVAQMIREDGIDILVDLAGHTAGGRPLLFARKPAPIQINYLGYPHTTGLTTVDYRLTDAYIDPPGASEQFHSEELIRLPGTFACYRPPDEAVTGPVEIAPRIGREPCNVWMLYQHPGEKYR